MACPAYQALWDLVTQTCRQGGAAEEGEMTVSSRDLEQQTQGPRDRQATCRAHGVCQGS